MGDGCPRPPRTPELVGGFDPIKMRSGDSWQDRSGGLERETEAETIGFLHRG